jgi:subtilisin family serine protease
MKKFATCFLTLAVSALFLPMGQRVYSQKHDHLKSKYAAGQMIVKLRPQAEAEYDGVEVPEFVARARGYRMEPLNYQKRDGEYLVHLDSGVSVEDAVAQASADPRVEYAEPDYLLYTDSVPNDSRFDEQWGLFNDGVFGKSGADIAATRAWDFTTGSESIVVAVIDTGVDLSHPDLAPNAWVNPFEIAGDGVDNDNNGYVDDINGWDFANDRAAVFEDPGTDFHGTHVAGTIGAEGNNGFGTAGVAWRVKIMSLKFLSGRSGSSSNAVKAIKYATDLKQRGQNVCVINASWSGSGGSDSLFNAIKKAGEAGIVFVCAAGNGGDDNRGDDLDVTPAYPAAWSEQLGSVISVTALDRADEFSSIFYNYSFTKVDVGAPGVNVLSTYPGGSYVTSSGTSMATPHVSGIAALLFSYEPQLTPAQVKERIVRTAEPTRALASIVASSGRANAFNAVTNTVPTVSTRPAIRAIRTNKKVLTIDGVGFYEGSVVVKVNGVTLPAARFDPTYKLSGGSFTQLTVKLGKAGIKSNFPTDQTVQVIISNTGTGEDSPIFLYRRV